MSKFYEILTASPLGDPWGEGNKNQTYWCQVDGIDFPVSISAQKPINPGDQKYGDLITDDGKPFKGAKSEYYRFKSAMVPQGTQRPQSTGNAAPTQQTNTAVDDSVVPQWFNPYAIMLKQMYEWEKMKHIPVPKEEEPFYEPKPEEKKVEAPATEPIGGGSITKEELEDIFGGELAPIDMEDK